MTKKFVNIFEYTDFRKFLGDYQKKRYETDPEFSRNNLCKKLGLPNTRSYFRDVIGGKKVTDTFVDRFSEVFELDKKEQKYFKTLVHFDQTPSEIEREVLFDKLISLTSIPKKYLDPSAYVFYNDWCHSAIRALFETGNFKNEYALIGNSLQPKVTPARVKESVKLLSRLGLIKKNKAGYFKPTDKTITTGSYVKDELIKQYQLKSFEIGKWALLSKTNKLKNMSTMTLSVSDKNIQKIEKKIQKFKNEVRSLLHRDQEKSKHVYQLNIQYFSQSK